MKKIFVVLLLCMVLSLTGCSESTQVTSEDLNASSTIIAVEGGTPEEHALEQNYPNAQRHYVSSISEGFEAVNAGRANAIAGSYYPLKAAIAESNNTYHFAEGSFGDPIEVVVGIAKGTKVPNAKERVNTFLHEIRDSGLLDDMTKRWFEDNNYTMPDIPTPANPETTIRIATTGLAKPYTFMHENTLTGMDIELAKRFALYMNADIEIEIFDWNGIYAIADSDKTDYLFSEMYKTKVEGKMAYSESYHVSKTAIALKNQSTQKNALLRFYENFIQNAGWRSVLDGFLVTLEITALFVIFGTLLGFLLWTFKMRSSIFAKILIIPEKIFSSIPILVIMMYLYYVFLKGADKTFIAVIAFSLVFAFAAEGIITGGIAAVDECQWEAGKALGFNKKETFKNIVFPQAIPHILPSYITTILAFMLLTSVCGYLSIVDLTFAVSMLQSQTYSALMPLTVAAVLYFGLSWIITTIFQTISRRIIKNFHFSVSLKENRENDYEEVAPYSVRNDQSESRIIADHIQKNYGEKSVLNDIHFSLKREVVSIIGPSGCGKSTLVRILSGLEEPSSGTFSVNGRTGFVFNDFRLFPHLNIIENIMIAPMRLMGLSRQKAFDQGMKYLRQVGLAESAMLYPKDLSDGQQQRAAIARTVAMEPEIIIFDDPTSALDPTTGDEIITIIEKLKTSKHSMLIATNDKTLAEQVSQRVIYLDEGIVYEEGTPEQIFKSPQKSKTRAFIQSFEQLVFTITSPDFDFISIINKIKHVGQIAGASQTLIQNTGAAFEELITQILLPVMTAPIQIKTIIHFAEDCAHMQVYYNGLPIDLQDSENELAVLLLKEYCEIRYVQENNELYSNLMILTINDNGGENAV